MLDRRQISLLRGGYMKVFVSQPMKGLTDAEIIAVRERIFGDYQAEHPDAVLLDSYTALKKQMGDFHTYGHPDVAMLAAAIDILANADVVLFVKGWEHHRGCRVEDKIATYYDIKKEYAR